MATEHFDIQLVPGAEEDMKALSAFNRSKVVEGLETHLRHEPAKASKSRIKLMEQPFWCQYRIRVEDFRVYYDVDQDKRTVKVLRVLEKGQGETPKEATNETN